MFNSYNSFCVCVYIYTVYAVQKWDYACATNVEGTSFALNFILILKYLNCPNLQ